MNFMTGKAKRSWHKFTVSIDKELFDALEKHRGEVKRSTVVAKALREYLYDREGE